jgi:hypothetical protein
MDTFGEDQNKLVSAVLLTRYRNRSVQFVEENVVEKLAIRFMPGDFFFVVD